jgi:ABC-type Fe3+-citrate transport system substrate-binding protein
MSSTRQKLVSGSIVLATLCLAVVFSSHAQTAGTASPSVSAANSQASMDAERAQIWNSPNMLRARAWLQDYCSTSVKVKPGEGEKYMNELANMTPTQMNLWLMKFDEEEDAKQQQKSLWKQAHSAALTQAMAADRNAQKSYSAISSEETQAAGQEEQQINEETQNQQNLEGDKQIEQGAYGPGGYGDGIHYHFHLYPY